MIVRPMPNFKSVAASMHIGIGAKDEAPNEYGLAHFVEHMLFKGTKTRTAEQVAATLSNLGVQYNAYTSNNATCYHTKGLITNLDDCCDVLSDMYFNLKFPTEDFYREAEVIVQEINMVDDNPRHALSDLCMETFFRGTIYEHPIAGSIKSVRGFKPEQIYDFIKRHYTAPNTIISFAGDITVEQAERVVKKYFLNNFREKSRPAAVAECKTVIPQKTLAKKRKKIAQHNVSMLFPAVHHAHVDKYALTILDGIFSADMSSRLFLSVREKLGLVYNICGGLDLTEIGGYYYICFACTPQNTEKVLRTITQEINKLKTDGITDEEVQKSKNIKKSLRLFEAEDVERTNQRNVTLLHELGTIENADQFISKIEKLTPKDIQDTANKYLDVDRAIVCVVGDNIKIRNFS
jgi:predicted Zn-dependent peptidase